ncbi:hypothetical protein CONCODRAFT_20635 [Conidiobolus coronatus NRRL 28638]|uniref:Uncharacterized protein n=1 Tax=Conidiobolus coronatus (strain ATCC 28846 / CBS 209.66 / NRRL 28638) TaxID=796925 RepID=A0A137NS86_CONC2|nr:hypothetical protein CONCODRAFT_20635 [Conidiobolus coronatus NRRL 28638]|eukprot:KXN65629.1 hypothetical protein CONCODRAFT_20635 [Conidiobolus coronatus NRRL 28638]
MTRNNFKGSQQYAITSPGIFAKEWKIENNNNNEAFWIQFNLLSPTILSNGNKDPLGKIYSPKIMSFKKNIDLNLQNSLVKVEWSHSFRTFKLVGDTDVRGFEKINWVWKREKFNGKLVLEDYLNGQCIAEFERHRFSRKEVGDLFIYPELPEALNLLIIYSASYSFKHIQRQERSAHGGS